MINQIGVTQRMPQRSTRLGRRDELQGDGVRDLGAITKSGVC